MRKIARSLLGERFCGKIVLLCQWREKKIRSTKPQILSTQAEHQFCGVGPNPVGDSCFFEPKGAECRLYVNPPRDLVERAMIQEVFYTLAGVNP
ncbi:hypothetical protein VNO77_43971 [Canavalia gladiata]|uniref:Uncharacterized protein n=1 Tax=Canavalia gladiata TaxID=3824 RepID=A0AAN9JYS3_CANGL